MKRSQIKNVEFNLSDSSNWPKDLIGIYLAYSKTTKRMYIGLTRHQGGFRIRWRGHRNKLRNDDHDNNFFQNTYNKYGENDICFKILEICPRDITFEALQKKERKYIKRYKSMHNENGWNIDTYDRYNKRKINYRPNFAKRFIFFEFISPSGEIIKGRNLNEFAREMSLCPCGLNRVLNGKQTSCKGYISTNPKFNKKQKVYQLISPDGALVTFHNIKEFALKVGISPSGIAATIRGLTKTCHGWKNINFIPKKRKLPRFICFNKKKKYFTFVFRHEGKRYSSTSKNINTVINKALDILKKYPLKLDRFKMTLKETEFLF